MAVVNVSQAGVLTLWDWAERTSLLRVDWRDCWFGVVIEGFEKGALISCFRDGESLDMLDDCCGWRGIDEDEDEDEDAGGYL